MQMLCPNHSTTKHLKGTARLEALKYKPVLNHAIRRKPEYNQRKEK